MTVVETVHRWHAEGKLDAEYAKLARVLASRKFTREQIQFCFENTLPGIAVMTVDPQTRILTLEALRTRLQALFSDEVRIVEACLSIATSMGKSESELLQELKRTVKNRIWQSEKPDENEE